MQLPLFGNEGARFETPKFTWIGNADEIIGTCGLWSSAGISSFDHLFKKPVKFGGAGKGSSSVQHVLALNKILGTKIELIKGYAGSNDINLAMQRGEVAGTCGLSLSTLKATYGQDWKAGRLKPVIQFALEKAPELMDVQRIYDYAKSDEMRGMFDLIFGLYAIGRPVLASPGVPPDRTRALRDAFMATMKDPKLLAAAKKARLDITASSGEAVEKLVKRFYAYPKEVVDKVSRATK